MITHEWDEILSRPFQCAGAEDEWDKTPRLQEVVSLRSKSHITCSAYMSTSTYLAFLHSHVCIKMHIRRHYAFILQAEGQHSQTPGETNWDLSPASTSLSFTSLQLTLKNSLQLSFPSLLICKMELLIPFSLAKCIWEALIRHEIGRKAVKHHTPIFIAPKDTLWKWELVKTFQIIFHGYVSWLRKLNNSVYLKVNERVSPKFTKGSKKILWKIFIQQWQRKKYKWRNELWVMRKRFQSLIQIREY